MEEQIEALKTADEYLNKLRKGTVDAAVLFQSGQEYKGFQFVTLIAEGISWLVQVIELTRQFQIEDIPINNVMDIISEINEAMEKRDTVTISDLLEFEVSPILQEWQESIQKLLKYKN
ncbi:hypothetical protein Desaci_3838 [Desulfosporosinus acidiphilus SJ4]|uniref:DUF8042 domain-containing protein n=1 Tax=Desulfosporosinus acidiphilus (strain DSM 22704 / JCM 16185 / SJ4) TaxID=646529 RepID=I4DA95_DESAJ|nr:hypothetical protein [Desulfosporosinus acidiphilus]AFM42719.1 hypothetical protein Desaci_3838 [Desulfosporosinus acidiphilus SJ4]